MPLALDASGVSTTNLVAYYKFESGAITTDSSGNSKTLTNNGTVASVAGLFGNCADLGTANTTKYFSRADGLGVDMSGAFSVNLWVKIRTELSSSELYEFLRWKSTTGTARYLSLYYQSISGTRRLVANNSEGYAHYLGINPLLGVDNWHMVSVVASGTTHSLYLNGEKVATQTRGTTTTAESRIGIGSNTDGTNLSNAYLDDFSFWSRALTDVEIATLYDLVPSSIILV